MSVEEKRLSAVGSAEPTPMEVSPSASDRQLYNGATADAKEPSPAEPTPASQPRSSRWKLLAALGCLAFVILVLVIILPVYFLVIKKRNTSTGGHGGSGGGGGAANGDDTLPVAQPNGVTSGGDGSTVYTDGGASFTYTNKFGGHWSYDPAKPFANGKHSPSSPGTLHHR